MPKLSVHLVAWNGAKYVPYLFESLRSQIFKDWELLVIDNNSTDGTPDLVEQELRDFPVAARLIRNEKNLGFAGGHNQAIQFTVNSSQFTEYFQLLNQDLYLAPDYLEKVVEMMEARPEAGAGQGLLLKWNFSKESGIRNQESGIRGATDIVDTAGLRVLRNRRVIDFKTGEQIHNSKFIIHNSSIEVFGVSGALPIYRRKAIEDVVYEDQMLDEDFFMYKEDVDLAFRLRSAGWKAYVATGARAWHDRTAAGPRESSDRAALANRRTKSAFINYHSYKNHLMVLLKNEHCANFAKDWPAIVWYEFKKFVYLLFTDWATVKGLREVCKLWKRTMAKRAKIMRTYKVKPEEIRKWFLATSG